MDFPVNGYGSRLDLRFEAGVFTDSEVAAGVDFTFDLSINDEVVVELNGAFDFDIRGKDVAGSGSCGIRRG